MAVSPAALSYEQPTKYFSFRSGNFWIKNILFSFNHFQSFSKIVQKTFLGKTWISFSRAVEAMPQSRI